MITQEDFNRIWFVYAKTMTLPNTHLELLVKILENALPTKEPDLAITRLINWVKLLIMLKEHEDK